MAIKGNLYHCLIRQCLYNNEKETFTYSLYGALGLLYVFIQYMKDVADYWIETFIIY